MNFQNMNFDHVEPPRQWPPQSHPSETSHPHDRHLRGNHQRNHHHHRDGEDASPADSLAPAPSIAPAAAPTPPSPPSTSTEIYGPDRHQNYVLPPRIKPLSQMVRFDETNLAMLASPPTGGSSIMGPAPMQGLKDALALAAGKVTPGVDDAPYIQYAIQALTRRRANENDEDDDEYSDGGFEEEMEGIPTPPEEEDGLLRRPDSTHRKGLQRQSASSTNRQSSQRQREAQPLIQTPTGPSQQYQRADSLRSQSLSQHDDFRTLSPVTLRSYSRNSGLDFPPTLPRTSETPAPPLSQTPLPPLPPSNTWVPVTKEMRDNFYPNDNTCPPLTFKPRILRLFSLLLFTALCAFMAAGAVASAAYSSQHDGLVDYPGTIYSGSYFLFRILPQLIGAGILLYAQNIVSTSTRILPLATMASEDARERYLALFQKLHVPTFLYPSLQGPWQIRLFNVATWLCIFTVPLLSSLYTCILVDGEWTWAAAQGVAYTLLALYAILGLSAVVLMTFWFRRWTGLMWDVRSIADILPLLNRCNSVDGYRRAAEAGTTMAEIKDALEDHYFDRLGYWRTDTSGGTWYAMGSSGTPADKRAVQNIMGRRPASATSRDMSMPQQQQPSFMSSAVMSYLPLPLRTFPLVVAASVSGVLLLALLIVSFLPQTRLDQGFEPLLPARPINTAFSAANFLYSFLPSCLGMILFLLFQSLDHALRTVKPWAEMNAPDGAVARKSILAEYAASSAFGAVFGAARVGHWRVAVTSLTSLLALGIPVLAGGLFMALTGQDGDVKMFPSIPVYGVLLSLLFLTLTALTLVIPRRAGFRLPHEVDTLAGIITLCVAKDTVGDEAFRAVRSRADLEGRLGADRKSDPRRESVWTFGHGVRDDLVSVRRLKRYTEKGKMMTMMNYGV
ncbi:uncharacterized protein F5Z01DRAFT_202784 [Emericellopsis atlantica]|uniref:Phosphoribosylaminoimidazole-succinocarboxamide synthase n=1 Tax=Emericellopsis atlantica TaxID=2614577 RepID=A0A9P7ZUI3_9HYPO|nr:uncharacterized protein F5Z01DRAFT_202784 [Emericellopsis atlantica]KAG9258578.1 hypothetical protein F5Z01DRAFT_202784 [Emericellopsis atlantica]